MKSVLIDILTHQKEYFYVPQHLRDVQINTHLLKIQSIVGPRWAGKSSLLKLAIDQLLNQGEGWDKICYISFEDERLRREPFEPDIILQAFAEMSPELLNLKDVWFIFDEIQYLQNWGPFVNRIHEQISKKVILTGSNSKTLHTRVAPVMRGRGIPLELLPLSFKEYLVWQSIPFEIYGTGRSKVISAFRTYMHRGGYPEVVLLPENQQLKLLHEYFNAVMFRDILDQQQPANYSYLRYLLHRIASNVGKSTNLRKIYQELKSRGFAVSQGTIYEMAQLAEDVYLHKRISKFDPSVIKRENTDKKSYFIDNGMLRALNTSFSDNHGALLENLILWQLYRQYGSIYTTDIYYYKDQSHECDFVLYKEGGTALPVQVCLRLDEGSTKHRELAGLIKACRQTESQAGIIITAEEENEIWQADIKIMVIPVWKWCALKIDLFAMI